MAHAPDSLLSVCHAACSIFPRERCRYTLGHATVRQQRRDLTSRKRRHCRSTLRERPPRTSLHIDQRPPRELLTHTTTCLVHVDLTARFHPPNAGGGLMGSVTVSVCDRPTHANVFFMFMMTILKLADRDGRSAASQPLAARRWMRVGQGPGASRSRPLRRIQFTRDWS